MANKTYIVYKHTTPDGKVYIGATNQTAIHRWGLNGNKYAKQPFGKAIEIFGWDNICHEILYNGLTKEEAESIERSLISQYNSRDPAYGYNRRDGGNIATCSEESKEKISKALKGRKLTDEHRTNIARCRTGWYFSEEVREKISEKKHGQNPSEETKEKLRLSHQWQTKPVIKLSMDNEPLEIFQSLGDAARDTGCSKLLIRRVCQGQRKSTNGFRWAFYEGGDDSAERI